MIPQGETLALSLENLTAGYGRSIVLRDVNLSVREGTVAAMLGANGAGKTTLLRVAAGLLPARAGAVRLFDSDITKAAAFRRARGGLCLIQEGHSVFPTLTVQENLALYSPTPVANDVIGEALAAFPALRPRLAQLAGSMSGGEQQMLALARVYVAKPRVVLVDEVSMGLAPLVVSAIYEAIAQMAKSGTSILLVEQYASRALELADDVYVMSRGEVAAHGSPADFGQGELLNEYLGGR